MQNHETPVLYAVVYRRDYDGGCLDDADILQVLPTYAAADQEMYSIARAMGRDLPNDRLHILAVPLIEHDRDRGRPLHQVFYVQSSLPEDCTFLDWPLVFYRDHEWALQKCSAQAEGHFRVGNDYYHLVKHDSGGFSVRDEVLDQEPGRCTVEHVDVSNDVLAGFEPEAKVQE